MRNRSPNARSKSCRDLGFRCRFRGHILLLNHGPPLTSCPHWRCGRTEIFRSKHYWPVESHLDSINEGAKLPTILEWRFIPFTKTSESPGSSWVTRAVITSASNDQITKTRDLECELRKMNGPKVEDRVFQYDEKRLR